MSYILNACLFRIVLPILMLICVVFRPSVLSAVYLLFTLCSAFCKVPSHRSMAGGTGIYLKILIVVSILGMLSQGAFQIYLIATGPYASVLDQMDEKWVEVLRYCGYVRMDHANPITIITWISPEILLPLTAVVIFTLIRRLTSTETDPSEAGEVTAQAMKVKRSRHRFFLASGTYILVLTLCVCAVLRPSVQGGVYFLAFICAATWLSCSKRLERGFAYITRLLMVLVFVHIAALYTYQIEYIKDLVGDNSTYTRYFALTEFYTLDADDPRIFVANTLEWDSFLNPWCLVFLFFMSTMMSRHLLKPKVSQGHRSSLTSEHTPLMRGVSPSRKYGTESKKGPAILQDSTGSVIVAEHEDIQLNRLEEEKTSCLETMLYVFDQLLQFVVQISYIATNIIMMTWSITYHSWLTFVLLLWANLLWIIPNQRRSMLRSSPFLVFYAIFLLISAYIYSMDLTEDELPSQVQGINLAQIGFEKITELPCRPLLAKCAYTMFFWFTLRQYTKELKEAKQSSTLADMVAPLQVTVGTAAGVPQDNAEHEASKVLGKIGEVLKKFLTRSWIWVVAITLFVVAITGERMTVFRILYMALFLFFILTFQLSFRIWRKMMFGFWLTVIIYSMTMLILVYTYQFDNFPKYWTDYLHIPPEQQLDIGLQTYATSQLFVRLATPTSFVIVTVIQLHYFHKDFLSLSHPPVLQDLRHARSDSADASSLQGEVTDVSSSATVKTAASPTTKIDLTDIGHISTRQLKHSFLYYWRKLCRFMDLVYLFLEIHMHRFVLFVAVLMCIYDKCAIYSAVVLALLIGITVGRKVSIGVIYTISVFTAILLLLRMVYQVQYIPADRWNVTCQLKESNYTANDAEWMGFYKSTHLPSIVKWNIAYLSVVTLFSVIVIRQHNARIVAGTPITRIFFMFPSIRRFDADKNIRNVLKYFLNYGYYKFGFEISLIATVAVIGIRMDFYAACYAVWLCLLCSMNRETIKRGWWNVYLIFICMTISIEYFMSLGLLPSLCIEYPWYLTPTLARMQDWVFLMDNFHPPNARKLICEFLLLFFVARQRVVFRIEKRYADREYAGGSNASVTHFAEQKDFVNPVPDFITYTRTYLDVLKRLVLIGFMWITLGSLFLAGTNRVNIFSVGYLIGAFIFLWQGTDIYLRPIAIIIKHWNWLIYYNVFVILLKTSFQLVGCVFAPPANNETCWLIQLLGIGCVNKFTPNPRATLDETCHVPRESIGLAWDGVCFAFLIMQKRIFSSYNFFHIVDDTKATTILASRGCELIEQIRQKRMQEKEELEKQVLEKIKAKMDRIKATQQRIQGPHYEPVNNHYVDEPPLARSTSVSSCASATSQTPEAGYHTPIDEDEAMPLTPAAGSQIQAQAPSPFSAIMTVSLEGYLEPQRMSFSSPPNSELNPRPVSPDDSYPVFSPPPYDAAPTYAEAVNAAPPAPQRQITIGPPWMNGLHTPRPSVISYSSRSPLSHHTYGIFPKSRPLFRTRQPKTYKQAIRSGDYYMFDELGDEDDLDVVEELRSQDDLDTKSTRDKPGVGELLSTALKTDISTIVRGGSSMREIRRRASMPLSRQRSTMSARSQVSAPLSAPPIIEESPRRTTTPDDEKPPEPKPGTSKDEDDITEPPVLQKQSQWQMVVDWLLFTWKFIESLMVSLISYLNRYSKDFRYVVKMLTRERKILKESSTYTEGLRLGRGQIWRPNSSYNTLIHHARAASIADVTLPSALDVTPSVGTFSPSDSYRLGVSFGRISVFAQVQNNSESDDNKQLLSERLDKKESSSLPCSPEKDSSSQSTISNIDQDDDTTELSQYDQPTILRLAIAVWYILMSHSDILCYFIIFLNQIKSANFMTLPLPLAVFLWGTLTIPRPSKTFWVSLIAYTQGIVLVKCLFQFEFWPWNQYSTSSTYPYYPPRILGVEKNLTYAIWDLMLLFVLFFHRYLLKTLGLWKATIVTVPLLSDGEYAIQDISKKPERSTEKSEDIQDDEEDDEESKKLKVTIEATDMETYELFPNTINMATVKYGEPIKEFFRQLRDPTSRASTDVYSYMFLCDFFNFFVILIGYSSFGAQQGDGGVSSYLQDNRVPYLFLLMLILQFLLIIVDRAIFLRKNITAKIVFQFIQIGTLHIWLFVLFPVITERDFNSVIPPQMYYMVKCFYLLLSAYQIRCGYPMRILGNFLCKGYNYVNMFLFKGFMIVPFLFELRTVMDWMWTDTSMTVFDWIKMEDIFAQIFQLKCTRHVESEFPQPRGVKKASLTKYMMGGLLLFIIIAIIWFPLVFFSLGNAVGEPNIPYDVTLDIRIGPYEPVYHLSAQANSIFSFDANDFALFESAYHKDKVATTFLSNYQYTDVAAIKLSRESANIWSISPPDRTRMIEEVNSTNDISILLQYTISHKTSGNKEDPGIIRTTETLTMTPEVNGEPNPERTKLLRMLSGNDTDAFADAVSLDYILPKFLKVTNRGTAESVKKLMIGGEFVHANSLRSLNLTLTHSPDYPLQEWWTIQENCSDANYKVYLRKLPYVDCNAIMLYTFNDRIFPATLSLITAGGIIGVYTTLVFVASRFLRGFFSEICFKIMFDDMPNVDRVLQLCFDIYLVREAREFCLEEDLFAKLVFLFRSPETLIKWTRPKEETEDDDDPEGEAD